MKKIVLMLILSAGLSYAKAQAPGAVLPPKDRLIYDLSKSQSVYIDSMVKFSSTNSTIKVHPNTIGLDSTPFYSNMPVAKISRSNVDRMPVAKLGDPNTKYTMLVKKLPAVTPVVVAPKVEVVP